ncbi:hypothetical protein [Bacillus sp. NEB1478]|uniref:hypothetical protein n=1 Tax=Bacillus sp. NEB1478 TaxID=3073816 RepID=UPI002873A8ED|nr:hypothetical protein [Bacillus sp. NEB1478]WNB93419.1 hypothetical protein RGB74_07045 [Bacillus sp. NEB1478]
MDLNRVLLASKLTDITLIPIEKVLLIKKKNINVANKSIHINSKEYKIDNISVWNSIEEIMGEHPDDSYLFYKE